MIKTDANSYTLSQKEHEEIVAEYRKTIKRLNGYLSQYMHGKDATIFESLTNQIAGLQRLLDTAVMERNQFESELMRANGVIGKYREFVGPKGWIK